MYVDLLKGLYSEAVNQVTAYNELIWVGSQSSILSPFLLNFIIDKLLKITYSSFVVSAVYLLSWVSTIGLEYTDDMIMGCGDNIVWQFKPMHIYVWFYVAYSW